MSLMDGDIKLAKPSPKHKTNGGIKWVNIMN